MYLESYENLQGLVFFMFKMYAIGIGHWSFWSYANHIL